MADPGFSLYLVTDRRIFPTQAALFAAIEESLRGGLRALQLREKDLNIRELLSMAEELRALTARYGALLFVNDRVDIALAVGADGVHLGAGGIPPYAVRKAAKERLLIGVSAHGIEEARRAKEEGADFIALGPVYRTPSKERYGPPVGTEVFGQVCREVGLPVLAIGGITTERVKEVRQAGAAGVALIRGILEAGNVRSKTEEFMRLLE